MEDIMFGIIFCPQRFKKTVSWFTANLSCEYNVCLLKKSASWSTILYFSCCALLSSVAWVVEVTQPIGAAVKWATLPSSYNKLFMQSFMCMNLDGQSFIPFLGISLYLTWHAWLQGLVGGGRAGNKFMFMVHVDFHVDCECFSFDGAVVVVMVVLVVVVVVVGSVVGFLVCSFVCWCCFRVAIATLFVSAQGSRIQGSRL